MNIPSFEEAMLLTRTIDAELIFNDEEARAYYDLLCAVPEKSTILEIGLQYGRSSSIALQIAKTRNLKYFGVDPFTETPQAEAEWWKMAAATGFNNITLMRNKYEDVNLSGEAPFSLALIDGDHTTAAVTHDCAKVMPLIAPGGCICLHDWDRSHLPGVRWGAEATLGKAAGWYLESVTGTLAVWRSSE